VAILGLLAALGANAAAVKHNIRGVQNVQVNAATSLVGAHQQAPAAAGGTDYVSLGLGAGLGAVVAAAIAAVAMKFMGSAAAAKEGEETGEEKADAADAPVETEVVAAAVEEEETLAEVDSKSTDYQALLKVLAQKVAQEVGPKLSKGGAVKNVLDSRMSSFTEKAKSFLLSEMNGTAGAVLQELDAPEAMMLLDWDHAVEANFPPASILIAGVLSPSLLKIMSLHHLVQAVSVGLPVMILCVCAIYIDWAAPCAIPSIFAWLFTQTALAVLLFVGHGALVFQIWMGQRKLAAKAAEVAENNKDAGNMRDEFVGNTIILQESLLVENDIRHSFWNTVVGTATFLWVLTTIWNLFLICRYTFVPGVVAFHPDAAEVAKDDYCGAWMTVLVLRINMLLAVLFLFLNLATVVQWVCDMMIENQGFQDTVLKQARDMDKNGAGVPVMELLVKAFLLRGGSDTLNSRLGVVQSRKKMMEKEQAALASQLAAVSAEIDGVTAEEQSLKVQADAEGGDIAATVAKLTAGSVDMEKWRNQGDKFIGDAAEKAKQMQEFNKEAAEQARIIQEKTTEALEELFEKMNQVAEAAQNSETAKALKAKYAELEAKFNEAMATLQDPAFQQQLLEQAQQAAAQAQDLANQAVESAKDPVAFQKAVDAAQEAMAQAQQAAADVAAAANDPEKRKELQEAAEKAMKQAKAKASEAAAQLNDPEMQKKMKQAAQNAVDQAQLAAQSAIAAAQDPELEKKLKEAAQKAMDEAKAAAQKAKEAVNDPALKKQLEEAAKKLQTEAKNAADAAKAAAQDPELQKKLTAAAQKYKDEASTAVAGAAEAAQAAAKK